MKDTISLEYLKGFRDGRQKIADAHAECRALFQFDTPEYKKQQELRERAQAQVDVLNELIKLNEK